MVQKEGVPSSRTSSLRSSVITRLLVLIPLSLGIGCVQDDVEPLSVPLQYQPMASPTELTMLPDCAAVSDVIVIDQRDESALGLRANEDSDAPAAPVTTSSEVSEWIRTGAEESLRTSGASLAGSGAPVLRIRVERIRTFENVYRRSGYEARIHLSVELIAPEDGGTVCWRTQASGSAGNYGYSGSVENYQETLNHALDRALSSIFDSRGFRDAVCRSCE